MKEGIKHLKTEYLEPQDVGVITSKSIAYQSFIYIGSKAPHFPYKFKIMLAYTGNDETGKCLFETSIVSEFEIFKMVDIDEMYKEHIKMIKQLEQHLHETSDNWFLKQCHLPEQTLEQIKTSVTSANLFSRLITGLNLN